MKIKAAVVRQRAALFQIEDVELDDPREDEVLVRISGCGLCHTDLAARDQLTPAPLPIVLGHEGSGVVEKVGARVRKVEPGDHVVLSFLSSGGSHSRNTKAHGRGGSTIHWIAQESQQPSVRPSMH